MKDQGITLRKLDLLRYINDRLVVFFGINKITGYCRYRGRFTYRILNDLDSLCTKQKSNVLYVIYSHEWEEHREKMKTKIHGIFDEYNVAMQFSARRKVNADCMLVPLNKFVEEGVEL
jgi:hypothetical protein